MLSLCAGLLAMGLSTAPAMSPPAAAFLVPVARHSGSGSPSPGHQDPVHREEGEAFRALAASDVPGRFPEGSSRTLTEADLMHMTMDDLRLMRNEILARHGYIFPSAEVQRYFAGRSWYKGRLQSVAGLLTDVERANLDTIRTFEQAQGAPVDLAPAAGSSASRETPPAKPPGIPIPER